MFLAMLALRSHDHTTGSRLSAELHPLWSHLAAPAEATYRVAKKADATVSKLQLDVVTATPTLILHSTQFWCGGQMGMAHGAIWSRSLS